jgi:hypothetical protein
MGQRLMRFRDHVVKKLESKFGVTQLPGAGTELISDVDLALSGANAGEKLIAAEKFMSATYGSNWSRMLRLNLYSDVPRLRKYREILHLLSPDEKAAMLGRLTGLTRRFAFARMLQSAGGNRKLLARVRSLASRAGVDLRENELQALVIYRKSDRIARRNELLKKTDELMPQFENTAPGEEKVRLAEKITTGEMKARLYTEEAYVGPGALKPRSEGPLTPQEAVQSAFSQLDLLVEDIAKSGGDIVKAAREYEVYKYMNRFATVVRESGIQHPALAKIERTANLVYKGARDIRSETGHLWTSQAVYKADTLVRMTDLPQTVGSAPVTAAELKQFTDDFWGFVMEVLPRLSKLPE